jgi:error-prone DNA polymerase
VILSAGILVVEGEIQRKGEVVHVVARRLHDRSRPDPRDRPPRGVKARDIYVPDLHIDTLKTKTRDFR